MGESIDAAAAYAPGPGERSVMPQGGSKVVRAMPTVGESPDLGVSKYDARGRMVAVD